MPGINGIITKKIVGDEKEKLSIMIDSMLHEPFYTAGSFVCPEKGFFIGYVSIEGSFSDCMPIFNENKNLILFLTGECYLDQAEINGLKNRGHDFITDNASFLIHLYEEKGEKFFESLNGWYNGVILDLSESKATLFNDRYGVRRIYFHENNDIFVFSSEAKSLLAAFPELRQIDFQGVGEYLTYDCVLENKTYFSKIFLLPPGSSWSFGNGGVIKKRYFDPASLENQTPLAKENFFEELGDTFKRILPRYFMGGNVGLSLTGGLDTRSILACADLPSGKLPCYTFGGTYRDILDVRLAPKVARACNQPHQVLRLDDSKYLSEYASHVERSIRITDGLVSVDMADVICFNKLAREIAPIRMTGKYGSQVLKGIIGFKERTPDMRLINNDFQSYIEKAKDNCSKIQRGNELTFVLQSAIPWWWNGVVVSESSQVAVRSPFLDNDFISVLYRAPRGESGWGVEFELRLIKKNKPELMSIPTTGTYGGNYPALISQAVRKGLGLLLILDKIYIREMLPFGLTHLIGRLDHLVSPLRLDRLLTGFAEFRRYRVWFRDQLAPYVQQVLLDKKTFERPFWNKEYLQKIVNEHIRGRGTYLREIRKALQIELIHRILIER